MNLSKKQLIIAGAAVVLVIVLIVLFSIGGRSGGGNAAVNLTIWGTDSPTVFQTGIFPAYKTVRPNVILTYTQIPAANYETTLLQALAAGQGPDIVVVRNHSIPKERAFLTPINPSQLSLSQFEALYPTAVEQDFVSGGQIYALPLYLDTMALVYNKDLFDQAAIASPPATWDDVQSDIPKLRTLSPQGQLTRAAAAIGGTNQTIDHGSDLLYLLMMQNGALMADASSGYANLRSQSGDEVGLAALNFYLQFSNAASSVYTWNESQPNSLDAFAAGTVGMIFEYERTLAALQAKSPFLRIGVAPMPQPSGTAHPVAYPDYDGLAVAKQSKNAGWAWDFISFLTTQPEHAKLYLEETNTPPALRSLIAQDVSDPATGVFASQALIARSWYEADPAAAATIADTALRGIFSGALAPRQAIDQITSQLTQTMKSAISQ